MNIEVRDVSRLLRLTNDILFARDSYQRYFLTFAMENFDRSLASFYNSVGNYIFHSGGTHSIVVSSISLIQQIVFAMNNCTERDMRKITCCEEACCVGETRKQLLFFESCLPDNSDLQVVGVVRAIIEELRGFEECHTVPQVVTSQKRRVRRRICLMKMKGSQDFEGVSVKEELTVRVLVSDTSRYSSLVKIYARNRSSNTISLRSVRVKEEMKWINYEINPRHEVICGFMSNHRIEENAIALIKFEVLENMKL